MKKQGGQLTLSAFISAVAAAKLGGAGAEECACEWIKSATTAGLSICHETFRVSILQTRKSLVHSGPSDGIETIVEKIRASTPDRQIGRGIRRRPAMPYSLCEQAIREGGLPHDRGPKHLRPPDGGTERKFLVVGHEVVRVSSQCGC